MTSSCGGISTLQNPSSITTTAAITSSSILQNYANSPFCYPTPTSSGITVSRVKHYSGGCESVNSDTTTGSNCSSSPCGSTSLCQSPLPPAANNTLTSNVPTTADRVNCLYTISNQQSDLNPISSEFTSIFAGNEQCIDLTNTFSSNSGTGLNTSTLVPSETEQDNNTTLLRNTSPNSNITQSPGCLTHDQTIAGAAASFYTDQQFQSDNFGSEGTHFVNSSPQSVYTEELNKGSTPYPYLSSPEIISQSW